SLAALRQSTRRQVWSWPVIPFNSPLNALSRMDGSSASSSASVSACSRLSDASESYAKKKKAASAIPAASFFCYLSSSATNTGDTTGVDANAASDGVSTTNNHSRNGCGFARATSSGPCHCRHRRHRRVYHGPGRSVFLFYAYRLYPWPLLRNWLKDQ